MGTEWIDDLSHELRAPLANLSARLEAMEDGLWPADPIHLGGCRDDVNRLIHLVERIEAVARADSMECPRRALIRLDHVIARACAGHDTDFLARGIALSWDCDPIPIRADEVCLGTVFSELLANAAQATPRGGHVEIRAKTSLLDGIPHVEVVVSDDGQGISLDALPHVFERFYRVDPSRSSSTGGPGLGLTLCHSLIKQHGGTIAVESRPGQGSEFRIDLPQFNPEETIL